MLKKLSIVITLLVTGCAGPPAFTGNGTNLSLQGGTAHQNLYVSGYIGDSCNQLIRRDSKLGPIVGAYVDDSVPNERQCVRQTRAYGFSLIIAAQNYSEWPSVAQLLSDGATYVAYEEYPFCGSRTWGQWPPLVHNAYIIQWNFVWPTCGPTPKLSVERLARYLWHETPRPKFILWY